MPEVEVVGPVEYYDQNIRYEVKLDSPLQYGKWLDVIEEGITYHDEPRVVYTDTLDTHEPYLVLSESEKISFKERANLYIERLVKLSISKRLANKLSRLSIPAGREQVEFLKKYMTFNEESIAPAILQFVQAIDPSTDVSPLKRYIELVYSKYINLSEHHKARLLYIALGEPFSMEDNIGEWKTLSELEPIVDLLENKYQRKKNHLSNKRQKRSPLFCYFCNHRGHLDEGCFQKCMYEYGEEDSE